MKNFYFTVTSESKTYKLHAFSFIIEAKAQMKDTTNFKIDGNSCLLDDDKNLKVKKYNM